MHLKISHKAPFVDVISPHSGYVGSVVTITGGFAPGFGDGGIIDRVLVGDANTSIISNTSSSITVHILGPSVGVAVEVYSTTGAYASYSSDQISFLPASPFTSISPSIGQVCKLNYIYNYSQYAQLHG